MPPGCPHAFFNPGTEPAKMLFLVTPPGHEDYLQEIADHIAANFPPDPAEIAAIRSRHDIRQLTPLINRPRSQPSGTPRPAYD
ncbi:cupin domain-containing protein [Actinomadura sp. 6N118]|uniref:cupin domain-containing protein n=1 Tax=Actinomadura sp. 6N118 TaxID=3375151 RepID=UPI00378BED09